MLVLSRNAGESITIEGGITIKILKITENQVRIGIDAPPDVRVLREELATVPGARLRAPEPVRE